MPCIGPGFQLIDGRLNGPQKMSGPSGERGLSSLAGWPASSISPRPLKYQAMAQVGEAGKWL